MERDEVIATPAFACMMRDFIPVALRSPQARIPETGSAHLPFHGKSMAGTIHAPK